MTRLGYLVLSVLSLVAGGMPAFAQDRAQTEDDPLEEQQPVFHQSDPLDAPDRPGVVAESAVGRVGQRQTREEAAPNVHPMERISNRIQNRVQSRIDSRIDREYNPHDDANDSFAAAEDKARIPTGR